MNSFRNDAVSRGTILVVDDDPAILVLIHTVLTASDYRVLVAGGGEDAVRLAMQKHQHFDLALLDVCMPGMRPAQLAGKIRSLRPEIPILFMSGYVDEETIRLRLLDEFSGFLPKPFRPEALRRAMRRALETRPRHAAAGEHPDLVGLPVSLSAS